MVFPPEGRTYAVESPVPPALRQRMQEVGEFWLPSISEALKLYDAKLKGRTVASHMEQLAPTIGNAQRLLHWQVLNFTRGLRSLAVEFPVEKDRSDGMARIMQHTLAPSRWRNDFIVPPYPDRDLWWEDHVGVTHVLMEEQARALFTLYHTRNIPNNSHHQDDIARTLESNERQLAFVLGKAANERVSHKQVWSSILDEALF